MHAAGVKSVAVEEGAVGQEAELAARLHLESCFGGHGSVEVAADARRAGRAVQPGDLAGIESAAEQEAEEQDHRLRDPADQAAHAFTVNAGRVGFA